MNAKITDIKNQKQGQGGARHDFFENLWGKNWVHASTIVDAGQEPILILDKNFRVRAANEPFYRKFEAEPKDTENKAIYELAHGEWNIPALRKLLEDILPNDTFFKGFEVAREFPFIGEKVMLLSARQIRHKEAVAFKQFPPSILLAIEDVTEMMDVAKALAVASNRFQAETVRRIQKLELHIGKLEKEIKELKKR